MGNNSISRLPRSMGELVKLNHLNLAHNKITKLPKNIYKMTTLSYLNLSNNMIKSLDEKIGEMTNLHTLFLSFNHLQELPKSFEKLNKMNELALSGNYWIDGLIPPQILSFSELTFFNCSLCEIKEFPDLTNLTNLKSLVLSCNEITTVKFPVKMSKLVDLEISNNNIVEVEGLKNANKLIDLDLSGNKSLCSLDLTSLTELRLCKLIFCNFSKMPDLPKKKKKIHLMTLEGNALENNISPENHPHLCEIDLPQKFLDISLYNTHQSDSVLMIPSSNSKKNSSPTNNTVYLQIDKIADVSWSEMKGFRSTQEDSILIRRYWHGEKYHLYCVFDGHKGSAVAEFCTQNFSRVFFNKAFEKKRKTGPKKNPKLAIKETFEELHKQITKKAESISNSPNMNKGGNSSNEAKAYESGCTVCVAFVEELNNGLLNVYATNLGDARAVICHRVRATKKKQSSKEEKKDDNWVYKSIRITKDHKAGSISERKILHSLGSFISNDGRVNSDIAVSRAIGDYKHPSILQQPFDNVEEEFDDPYQLSEEFPFMILACDGLWDELSDNQAVNLVVDYIRSKGNSFKKHAATVLRDTAFGLGSSDNISVIVVFHPKAHFGSSVNQFSSVIESNEHKKKDLQNKIFSRMNLTQSGNNSSNNLDENKKPKVVPKIVPKIDDNTDD